MSTGIHRDRPLTGRVSPPIDLQAPKPHLPHPGLRSGGGDRGFGPCRSGDAGAANYQGSQLRPAGHTQAGRGYRLLAQAVQGSQVAGVCLVPPSVHVERQSR